MRRGSGRCTGATAALAMIMIFMCQDGHDGGVGYVSALGSDKYRVEDDLIFFHVARPRRISYVYRALMAKDFGGVLESRFDRVELVPSDPIDGCQQFSNSHVVRGQMVLIQRGVCSFAEKAWHAEQAGALAAFIYDSDRFNDNRWVDMVREQDGYDVTIPAMFVLGREGFRIVDGLTRAGTQSATITIPVNETHIRPHEFFPGVLW